MIHALIPYLVDYLIPQTTVFAHFHPRFTHKSPKITNKDLQHTQLSLKAKIFKHNLLSRLFKLKQFTAIGAHW